MVYLMIQKTPQVLCWFIQQDLTEPGYTTSIAHNYGILLEDFCLYEQYREHPLTSDDDYNDPYCDVYKSSFVQLHNLVRLVEPEQMRDVLKEAHEQKLGVVDYLVCRLGVIFCLSLLLWLL